MKAGIDLNVLNCLLHGHDIADIGYGSERFKRVITDTFTQNFPLRLVRWISHLDAHQEAIKL